MSDSHFGFLSDKKVSEFLQKAFFFPPRVNIFNRLQRTYAQSWRDIYEVREKDKKMQWDKKRREKFWLDPVFLNFTEAYCEPSTS